MFLPIGDDNPNARTPVVHYAIMAVNVAVFAWMAFLPAREAQAFVYRWALIPADFSVVNLFTSLYLHAGLMHVAGNMLFLWIVGDNVEDRLGHVGYFIFYHAAGAAASLTHVAFAGSSGVPLVGASGAISGVMGAYAIFFPNARIKIWYWFFIFFMDIVYVSAKWAVALWFIMQVLLRAFAGQSHVSYDAHIGGLIFGVAVAIALKAFILKPHDTVRRIVRSPSPLGGEGRGEGLSPLGLSRAESREGEGRGLGSAEALAKADEGAAPALSGALATNIDIENALASGRPADGYRAFTSATASISGPLDESTLARLAEALTLGGAYGPASRVYEEMLRAHPEGDFSPEAAFRLGTIQSRVFEDYLRARDNLVYAHRAHPNPDRRAQSLDELKRIDSHLRSGLFRRT